jgi:hypothetical protein
MVTLDLSRQKLSLSVPEDPACDLHGETAESPLSPSLAELDIDVSAFAPAALLALKAKQFDDGLYACVELAADAGLGRFPPRQQLLLRFLRALGAQADQSAAALLTAAARLGGQQPQVQDEVSREADTLSQRFLAEELRSRPLGFYTWSRELSRIFQRDRMLQTQLEDRVAWALSGALSGDDELAEQYAAATSLAEKLTNPSVWSDLRATAATLEKGHTRGLSRPLSFFPPSRAHETELIKKLYGDRPIPEGFNLADEMIRRIRNGTLDLRPTATSGWYDHQTYALEALASPESMPEGRHLTLEESYRKELGALFRALLGLTRETHVKQLEIAPASAAMCGREVALHISPQLTLNLLDDTGAPLAVAK